MTKRVKFPEFELQGPKCDKPNCNGVLVDHMELITTKLFKRCSVCKTKYDRTNPHIFVENSAKIDDE
jgi:hypothetical protein